MEAEIQCWKLKSPQHGIEHNVHVTKTRRRRETDIHDTELVKDLGAAIM